MRTVEHRRHTMRVKPGQHLSQPGVDLARAVGQDLEPFDRVVTSSAPRAFETAIAMGFAVDEQSDILAALPDGFADEIRWDEGISRFAEVIRDNPRGVVAQFARQLAVLHQEVASQLPANGRALVISHGGIVEASAIGCKPDQNYATWGPVCGYCEGVRLYFNGTVCERVELLRVRGPGPREENIIKIAEKLPSEMEVKEKAKQIKEEMKIIEEKLGVEYKLRSK